MNGTMHRMDKMYPEFTPPEDLKVEGDSGEAMVTWKRKPDGKICIKTFDGVPLSEETTESPSEEKYQSDLQGMAVEQE